MSASAKDDAVDLAARESLRLLGADAAEWAPAGGAEHDVAIIGAGQSGLTIAYALRRAGIRVTVLDASDEEHSVGNWAAKARMRKLRTGKTIPGPELGNPALGFRAWYEGRHGGAAYDGIDRIATGDWIAYLAWFQRQIGVTVRRGTRLLALEPAGDRIRLRLRRGETGTVEVARKVVLATGVEGTGGPRIPAELGGLPAERWAHTAHDIDFDVLRDKTVAVLGAAASAFDAAAKALEAGATEVHLFSRRPDLVIAGPGGKPPSAAAQETFHHLPDAERWRRRWAAAAAAQGSNTPLDSVQRATAYPNFRIHLDAAWNGAEVDGDRIRIEAADGIHTVDFVIAGTGYQQDPATRTELAGIADRIALWRDVHQPSESLRSDHLGTFPYVGPGYELTAKQPADAGWVSNIHAFNVGASLSFGRPVGDIPSLRAGVPRLVDAIVRDLVLAEVNRPGPVPAAPAAESPWRSTYEHAVWHPAAALQH